MERATPALIAGLVAKAEEKLRAARSLLAQGFPDDAVSRAYYAIFHAASAALLAEGIAVESHSALAATFGLHLVKPGKIGRRFGRILGRLKDEREGGDYDVFSALEADDAERAVEDADAFLQEMNRHLREAHNLP